MTDRRATIVAAIIVLTAIAACGSGTSTSPPTASDAGGSTAPVDPARPVLIDTDVAPDDLVAIAFLVASPSVEVRAITVSGTGEAHCREGVEVVLGLLERLDAPLIDVACGREMPIAGDRAFPEDWRTHADGGSGLELPSTSRQPYAGGAVQLIAETAAEVDGLRILTLGPMTNVADALADQPDLADRIESVYAMAGALFVPGNVSFGGPPENTVAEWNVYVDPTSVQAVIDSGVVLRLVSLDSTSQVPLTKAFAARVQEDATGPGAQVLAELLTGHPYMTDGTYFLWDPLAAAMAAGLPLGSFSAARVDVEEADGTEVGFTRPVDGTPNLEYLSTVDRAAAEVALLETLNLPIGP